MADLPDYYTQTSIAEAEAARFKGGAFAARPLIPTARDIYYAIDTKVLYICVIDGAWININELYLLLAGGTMTGNIAMGGSRVRGLADPALAQDAATKAFVEATAGGDVAAHALLTATHGVTGTIIGSEDTINALTALAANFSMNAHKLTDLAAPTLANDAVRKAYADLFTLLATFNNHKARHQDTGADEISVAGLAGLLADDQHVIDAEVLLVAAALVHAARHQNGGDDEISVAGLSGLLADDQHVLDAEAVSAMGAKADDNPLHHDRYTNANAVAAAEAAGLALASGKNIKIVSVLSADDTVSGLTTEMAPETDVAVAQAMFVFTDGKIRGIDADYLEKMPAMCMTAAALSAGVAGEVLLQGFMRHDDWNWTIGGLLYASTALGELQQTPPSGINDVVQVVGIAVTADIIYFSPSFELVEIS